MLLPPLVRNRGGSGPNGSSIGDFAHRIAAIGKTGGFHRRTRPDASDLPGLPGAPTLVVAPRIAPETRKRRRDVLTVVGTATVGSFLLAVVLGGWFLWGLFLVAAALLGSYLALLRHFVVQASMPPSLVTGGVRTTPAVVANGPGLTNVRFLPQAPAAPQFALRRTASS